MNANGIAQCDACVLSVVRGVPVELSAIACLERIKNPIKAARALYSTDLNAKGLLFTQKPILVVGEGAYEFAIASGCELSDSWSCKLGNRRKGYKCLCSFFWKWRNAADEPAV